MIPGHSLSRSVKQRGLTATAPTASANATGGIEDRINGLRGQVLRLVFNAVLLELGNECSQVIVRTHLQILVDPGNIIMLSIVDGILQVDNVNLLDSTANP